MATAHIKPDDIAPPIDIRLLPAVALTAGSCLFLPGLPLRWAQQAPQIVAGVAVLTLLLAALCRAGRLQRLTRMTVLLCLACWLALPATIMTQQQLWAAEASGWRALVESQGTARMSVRLETDPVQRAGPFGVSWHVTAQVEAFDRTLTPTPHPAKIIVTADDRLATLAAQDTACFIGQITESSDAIFVKALTGVQAGLCDNPQQAHPTGRDAIRQSLRDHTLNTVGFSPELLPGLILGDRSQQSEHLDQAMKISGLSHLSAVSGAHTSLIAGAATMFFRSLRLPRSAVLAAFLGTLALFVHIVGLQPSIIRAATMGAIGAWALYSGRGAQALPILSLSTIIILSVSPELIHEAGFQLSVAATAGIVIGAQPLERWFTPILERLLPSFAANLLSSSLAMSATAQLACQPILLIFIDYVSVYSLVANILATPLLPFITVPGTIAASLGLIAPGLSQLILHAVGVPAAAIGWIATTSMNLPAATLGWPTGPAGGWLIALHWMATGIIFGKLLRQQRRHRATVRVDTPGTRWQRCRKTVETRLTLPLLLQILIVVIAVVAHATALWPARTVTVSADWDIIGCDVGQGDMFLLRTGPTSAMVIDTGPDPQLALDCLAAARITHLDLVAITHLHADHVGGLAAVMEEYPVSTVIYSTGTDPSLDSVRNQLAPQAHRIDGPVTGNIDSAHDDPDHPVQLRWSVLSADAKSHNENNASLVLFVEILRHGRITTALFTGDLEEDQAQQLLAQGSIPADIDVLKLAHHGAKNGGVALLQHTNPSIALVGVGLDNTYGHPHPEILDALGAEVQLYRTDQQGTYSVTLHNTPVFVVAGG